MTNNLEAVAEIVEHANQTLQRVGLIEAGVLVLLKSPDRSGRHDRLNSILDLLSGIRTEQLSIKALF